MNTYSSYGQHLCAIALNLIEFGLEVRILPTNGNKWDERYGALIQPSLKMRTEFEGKRADRELLIHPPCAPMQPSGNFQVGPETCWWTMNESSEFHPAALGWMKMAGAVIVPCDWNLVSLRGKLNRVFKVPLGIDPTVFKPWFYDYSACVFGTAGCSTGQGGRKHFNWVIEAFKIAFPQPKEDVVLMIKGMPCDEDLSDWSPSIKHERAFWPEHKLAGWFQALTAFVSASGGEGWGLMMQQAMATGCPVIGPLHGGCNEFMDEPNSLSVPTFEDSPMRVQALGYHGRMAVVSSGDLAQRMRWVYENREAARQIGMKAAIAGQQFTWRNSTLQLLEVLRALKFL